MTSLLRALWLKALPWMLAPTLVLAQADAWPNRPLKMIVPINAGGGTADPGGALSGGYYVQPTVFRGHNRMRIFQEEIFGPVLSVTTFSDAEEALTIANDTAYGLTGSPSAYEYEHLIPLELGGATNSPRNLWPEPDTPGAPAGREIVHEGVPGFSAVRNGRVKMIVGDVGLQMEARIQGRVVDHEARRVVPLQPVERAPQPCAMALVMNEINAPVFIDDGPDHDRRVMMVAIDHSRDQPFLAGARPLGRDAAVR